MPTASSHNPMSIPQHPTAGYSQIPQPPYAGGYPPGQYHQEDPAAWNGMPPTSASAGPYSVLPPGGDMAAAGSLNFYNQAPHPSNVGSGGHLGQLGGQIPQGQMVGQIPQGQMGGPQGQMASGQIPSDNLSAPMMPFPGSQPQTNPYELEEPPLLDELGIIPQHIVERMKSVVLMKNLDESLIAETDMCGPMAIALLLGFCLLLMGKVHFGYIYGLGLIGPAATWCLLNLLSQEMTIDLYKTMSILGYGLLPVVVFAVVAVFVSLRNILGLALGSLAVIWCTASASRFFETALRMQHQRFLIAYPVGLLYTCFVLITVF